MSFGVMALSPGLACVFGVGVGDGVALGVPVAVGVVVTVAVLVGCTSPVTMKVVIALRGLNASVARIVCCPAFQSGPTANVTENVPSLPTVTVVFAPVSCVCSVLLP